MVAFSSSLCSRSAKQAIRTESPENCGCAGGEVGDPAGLSVSGSWPLICLEVWELWPGEGAEACKGGMAGLGREQDRSISSPVDGVALEEPTLLSPSP